MQSKPRGLITPQAAFKKKKVLFQTLSNAIHVLYILFVVTIFILSYMKVDLIVELVILTDLFSAQFTSFLYIYGPDFLLKEFKRSGGKKL